MRPSYLYHGDLYTSNSTISIGPSFNIKTIFSNVVVSYDKEEAVLRLSYLYHEDPYTSISNISRGPCFDVKTIFPNVMDSYYKDKTVVTLCYLYHSLHVKLSWPLVQLD